MLKKALAIVSTLGLVAAFATSPAVAGKGPGNAGGKVKGHVIKVEQHQRTGNAGEFTQLTIRTRNGDEMRLHLGEAGACQNCVQVGDRIQARLQGQQGPNGARQVQSMKVRRNGQMFGLSADGKGNLVRQHGRLRDGSGSGQQSGNQVRTRLKDGSNCDGQGPGGGQGGMNGGGGSRGGGGGGGRGRG